MTLLQNGNSYFCVDDYEVSAGDYLSWLSGTAAAPVPSRGAQEAKCLWKTDHAPQTSAGCFADQSTAPLLPIRCIDWCDADAYCHAFGKRLCGNTSGGANDYDAPSTSASEWYFACTSGNSSGAVYAYPYGTSYVGGLCDDANEDFPTAQAHDIAADATCTGPVEPFDEIFDLVGNVSEWEDACKPADSASDGSTDLCLTRGGSYTDDAAGSTCANILESSARASFNQFTGFRCCQ